MKPIEFRCKYLRRFLSKHQTLLQRRYRAHTARLRAPLSCDDGRGGERPGGCDVTNNNNNHTQSVSHDQVNSLALKTSERLAQKQQQGMQLDSHSQHRFERISCAECSVSSQGNRRFVQMLHRNCTYKRDKKCNRNEKMN